MLTTRLIYTLTYSKHDKALLNAARNSPDTRDTIKTMSEALANGAKINIQDIRIKNEMNTIGFQYTPLMWAVYNGDINKVKFLIKRGADLTLTTKRGNNVAHIAIREDRVEILKLIIHAYPDCLSVKGENNLTPYGLALQKWNIPILKLLNPSLNLYFPAAKIGIPYDLIIKILSHLKADPISFKNLSLVSKEWKNEFQNNHGRTLYENSVRQYLPNEIKNKSWKEILQTYYPSQPVSADPFKQLLFNLQTLYFQGPDIKLLQGTNFIENVFLILQLAKEDSFGADDPSGDRMGLLLLFLILSLGGKMGDFAHKQKNVSPKEIMKDFFSSKQSPTSVYRDLNKISEDEFNDAKKNMRYEDDNKTIHYYDKDNKVMFPSRKPIFEVTVSPEDALNSLQYSQKFFALTPGKIVNVKSYRFPQKNEEAKDAEKRLVKM